MFGDAADVTSQRCPVGNVASYDCVLAFARERIGVGAVGNESVLYFLEGALAVFVCLCVCVRACVCVCVRACACVREGER